MTQESRGRDTPATRRNVNAARRSAAASMCKSAESQDRIAQMYEERTEHGLSHDDLDHAACHRQFAQYDRRMAKRVRQSADKQLARRTWGEQGDGVSLSVRPRWLGPNGTPERSARTVTQVIETVSDCQLAGYVDQPCIAFLGNTLQQRKGSNRVDVEAGYKDPLACPVRSRLANALRNRRWCRAVSHASAAWVAAHILFPRPLHRKHQTARRRRSTRPSVSSELNSRKDRIGRIGVASARHADKAANGYRWRGARTDSIDIDSPHGGRLKRRVCITRCQALADTSRHRAVPETASTSGRSRTRLVSSTLNAHLLAGSLPRQQ